jgi:hypothetical protein
MRESSYSRAACGGCNAQFQDGKRSLALAHYFSLMLQILFSFFPQAAD